jgi:AcrR family transcriptional regulator
MCPKALPDRATVAPTPGWRDDDVPGHALPARQERSRELRDRLIASARALVDGGGFAGTSMAQIASAAGCSVGVLYQRFKDKDALFDSVVHLALDDALAQLRAGALHGRYELPTLEATVQVCVADYVAFVRGHEGLVRALYQRTLVNSREWMPMRSAGYAMAQVWVDAIVHRAGREGDQDFRRRAMVAFQFASGTLVHAVQIQPIVLGLHDDELLPWLVEMVNGMVVAGLPAAATSMRPSLSVVAHKGVAT